MNEAGNIEVAEEEEYHIEFKKHYSKISLVKIIFFLLIFAPFIYLSSHGLNDTQTYSRIILLTDTILGISAINSLFSLGIFALFFFFSSKARREFFRFNKQGIFFALKVFLFSLLILTCSEMIFSKTFTLIDIFKGTSYRNFIADMWQDLLLSTSEELIFKWLLLTQVLLRLGNKKGHRVFAYVLIGVIFAASHIPKEFFDYGTIKYGHLALAFCFFYFSSILFVRYRNFLLVVLLHFLADIPAVFLEYGDSQYSIWGIVLMGIYSIPWVRKSRLLAPVTGNFSKPVFALLGSLMIATLCTPFVPKKSIDFLKISKNQYRIDENHSALKSITLAITEDPNNEELWNFRGVVYYSLGEYDNAWSNYNKAATIDTNYYYGILNRGIASRKLKAFDASIHDLTIAIKLDSKSSDAYETRGTCYLNTRQMELAKSDFQKALDLNSSSEESYFGLCLVYSYYHKIDSVKYYLDKGNLINPKFEDKFDHILDEVISQEEYEHRYPGDVSISLERDSIVPSK